MTTDSTDPLEAVPAWENCPTCGGPMGWMPIKTAPHNRWVLLFKAPRQFVGLWAMNPLTGAIAWSLGDLGNGERALVENPTHWRELLAPPNPQVERQP